MLGNIIKLAAMGIIAERIARKVNKWLDEKEEKEWKKTFHEDCVVEVID